MSAHPFRAIVIASAEQLVEDIRTRLVEEVGFEVVGVLDGGAGAERLQKPLARARPDGLFLEARTLEEARQFLRELTRLALEWPVVACGGALGGDAVVKLLRAGAFDYIDTRCEPAVLREVCLRLARTRVERPEESETTSGRVVGFTSCKPGAGATTLAAQAAFALRRLSGKRVLLADLNACSGVSSTWGGPDSTTPDVRGAVSGLPGRAGEEEWAERLMCINGIRALPAPASAEWEPLEPARLREFVQLARKHFDWVVLDMPCAMEKLTLALAPDLDEVVAVTTAELPSVHLAQRSLKMLQAAGRSQAGGVRLALNRSKSHDALQQGSVEQALKHKVAWALPNDYFALHASGSLALTGESALALAIRRLASGLLQTPEADKPEKSPAANGLSLAVAQ